MNLVEYDSALPASAMPAADEDGVAGFIAGATNGLKTSGNVNLSQPWTFYAIVQWRKPLVDPAGISWLLFADGDSDDVAVMIQTADSGKVIVTSGGAYTSPDSSISALVGSVPESEWMRVRVVADGASSLLQVEDTTETGTLDAVSFNGVIRACRMSSVLYAHWQLINGTIGAGDHDQMWAYLETIKNGLPDYSGVSRISVFDGDYRAHGNIALDTSTTPDTLIAAFRKGGTHLTVDGVGVIQTSTDSGATWSAESTFITPAVNDDARGPQVLVTSGNRWLVAWFEWDGTTGEDSRVVRTMYSDNQGGSWSSPVTVTTPADVDWLAVSGAPCELTSGDIILSTYGDVTSSGKRNVILYRSTDSGASWSEDSRIVSDPDTDLDEPNLVLYSVDKLVCFIRHTVSLRRATADETATPLSWTNAVAVDCSGFSEPHVALLSDGTSVLCVRGQQEYYDETGRQAFELWTSSDDGETWSGPQYPCPNERAFQYGTPIQLASGDVFAWWSDEYFGAGYYWKEITDDV